MPNLHIELSTGLLRLSVSDVSRRVREGDGPGERTGHGQGVGEPGGGECGGVAVFGHGGEVVFLRRVNGERAREKGRFQGGLREF